MPTQRYTVESNGQRQLELSWKGFWKDFTVRLDGTTLGTIPGGQKELQAGRDFQLPDQSTLSVKLKASAFAPELQVLRDGVPIPGSASNPLQRLKIAYGMVFFVGGLNIIIGLLSVIFKIEFLQRLGLGIGSVVFGVVFLVLGMFVMRRSVAALIAAIVLFALDGVLGIIFSVQQGGSPGVGGIIFRIFLIIPMVQGIGAIRTLKQPGANA